MGTGRLLAPRTRAGKTTAGAVRMAAAVVAGVLLAACSGGSGRAAFEDDDRLRIATTVAPITSIVASVVGDRAQVVGLVPEGVNSHTFEPRPSVAELLSTADVVYLNGLALEEPTLRLAEANLAPGAEVVQLGEGALSTEEHIFDFSFPRAEGRPNPHLWTDPTLALRYAAIVRDDASARDPENAGAYATNYRAFADAVAELDEAMRAAFATVPTRKLLTYHDAYAYFARTYGWEVIGAVQVSDFADPGPGEVAELIRQVEREGVPAIFGSEVFPSPVLEQIAREADVTYVADLRDDDLPGGPGDPEHSWLGLMRFNFVTITEALGGDASGLRALDPGRAPTGPAVYPQ